MPSTDETPVIELDSDQPEPADQSETGDQPELDSQPDTGDQVQLRDQVAIDDWLETGDQPEHHDHKGAPRHRTASDRSRPRGWIAAGTVAAALALYAGAAWLLSDRVPRGATVEGVALGGMTSTEAVAALNEGLGTLATEPVPVAVGEVEGDLTPATAGLQFDAEATVDPLVGFNLSPVRMWEHIAGMSAVRPESVVDEQALQNALEGMADNFAVLPVEGDIHFADGKPRVTVAEDGLEVDIPAAVEEVAQEWLTSPRPLELPTKPTAPVVSNEEVQRALTEEAEPLVSGPVTVQVDEQAAQVQPDQLASAATFVADNGKLTLVVEGDQVAQVVREELPELEDKAVDAKIVLGEGGPEITPHRQGSSLNTEELGPAVVAASRTDSRIAEASLQDVDPTLTAADMEALGIVEPVSEFATNLTSDPVRTENLRVGAAAISGVVLAPGETFSLLETLGPIDAEHGYGDAGVLVGGQLKKGMGGGLSQLATTLYNAVFFSGLEVLEHQPHTQYFSRYPEGREATIFSPDLDLKFHNDSDYGVLIESWVADWQIHVRFWSTKVWDIESQTSPRREITQPTTITVSVPDCVPSGAGGPGFLVTVDRVFSRDGQYVKTESSSWRYQPVNAVQCAGQ